MGVHICIHMDLYVVLGGIRVGLYMDGVTILCPKMRY